MCVFKFEKSYSETGFVTLDLLLKTGNFMRKALQEYLFPLMPVKCYFI